MSKSRICSALAALALFASSTSAEETLTTIADYLDKNPDVQTESNLDVDNVRKDDTAKEKELKIKLDKEKDADALEKQLIALQGQLNITKNNSFILEAFKGKFFIYYQAHLTKIVHKLSVNKNNSQFFSLFKVFSMISNRSSGVFEIIFKFT